MNRVSSGFRYYATDANPHLTPPTLGTSAGGPLPLLPELATLATLPPLLSTLPRFSGPCGSCPARRAA